MVSEPGSHDFHSAVNNENKTQANFIPYYINSVKDFTQ